MSGSRKSVNGLQLEEIRADHITISSQHAIRGILYVYPAATYPNVFSMQLSDGSFNNRGLSVSRYLDMAKALSNRKSP